MCRLSLLYRAVWTDCVVEIDTSYFCNSHREMMVSLSCRDRQKSSQTFINRFRSRVGNYYISRDRQVKGIPSLYAQHTEETTL